MSLSSILKKDSRVHLWQGTDIVVFGATGFTGKHAVFELAVAALKHDLTWAIAGRNQEKLHSLLLEVTEKTGRDHSQIPIVIADIEHEDTLRMMCAEAKVVINCCGPYRLYGEAVVRAAIAGKAHYVDVSGEPEFIETMQLLYGEVARSAGVYVISACGFDSVPNDLGVIFMEKSFDGTLNSVESYLTTVVAPEYVSEARRTGIIHYGTWDSLVRSVQSYNQLRPLRKKLYPTPLPVLRPQLQSRGIHRRFGTWCIPFLGADSSIVYRTQRHLLEKAHRRPVQFKPYVKIGGFLYLFLSLFAGAMLYLMTKTAFTTKLLLKYPRFFSFGMVTRDGPSENVINNTYYKFELFGEGWDKRQDLSTPPNKTMTVKVSGMNPGYGATVSALVYSAITLLKEADRLPSHGGVMTTGTAFRNTDLIGNLVDKNMKFEIISGQAAKLK